MSSCVSMGLMCCIWVSLSVIGGSVGLGVFPSVAAVAGSPRGFGVVARVVQFVARAVGELGVVGNALVFGGGVCSWACASSAYALRVGMYFAGFTIRA